MSTTDYTGATRAAAEEVATSRGWTLREGEDPIVALGFEMGDGIEYEAAMLALVTAAIEADRAQIYRRVLSFEADAIRAHFEGDEDDPTAGMTDEELDRVGQEALQDDRLYAVFHELLTEGVRA